MVSRAIAQKFLPNLSARHPILRCSERIYDLGPFNTPIGKFNLNKIGIGRIIVHRAVRLGVGVLATRRARGHRAQIAERVNLSTSPCWRRIQRLEKDGYIDKRVALLNGERLGLGVVIFASISLAANDEQSLEQFEAEIARFPEVLECYTVTGTMDYFVKIVTRDIRGYESFLRQRLLQIPLIRELHSNVAVTQIKFTTSLPLATQVA